MSDDVSKQQRRFEWGEPQMGEDAAYSLHCYIGDELAGFLDIYKLPTGEFGIDQITVQPQQRRQGIATELFERAQERMPTLVLHSYDWTDEGRAWAESMWLSHGLHEL